MSGIVGLFYLDGRPVDPVELGKMTDILAHRGPDDADIWYSGSVGLGHRMLWTTPESLQEKLPATNQSGHLVITADARIDNRDELIPQLGLNDRPAGDVTDSQLILAAYEKWGAECPEKLIGDFAFVIWDGCRQEIFCARDHMGVNPFFYHYCPSQMFVLGSEIKALLCLPSVPHQLNESAVGFHLALTYENKTFTFFDKIFRLPPGNSLTVSKKGLCFRTFWSLDPSREIKMNSNEEYAEAFLEIFTEAVRCRLRSAFPIASMLSGGLDSSAVTCLARDLLVRERNESLHTVSSVYDEISECDERQFINPILDQGNLDPHYIYGDQLSPLVDVDQVFTYEDETYPSPTMYLVWYMCRTLREKTDARVFLDGVDGDTAVSHGTGYLAELARSGRWQAFRNEAVAYSRHHPEMATPTGLVEMYALPYLTELARNHRWKSLAKEGSGLSRTFGVSRRDVLWHFGFMPMLNNLFQGTQHLFGNGYLSSNPVKALINQDFAKRTNLNERLDGVNRQRIMPVQTAREEHYRQVTANLVPLAFEGIGRVGAAFGLEARHPFTDRRLLEFSLALPPEQKLFQGWDRVILRRAIEKIVPCLVQWRPHKTSNSPAFTHTFKKFGRNVMEQIINDNPKAIAPYVNIENLREIYRRYLAHKADTSEEMQLWQTITLQLWLNHTGISYS